MLNKANEEEKIFISQINLENIRFQIDDKQKTYFKVIKDVGPFTYGTKHIKFK